VNREFEESVKKKGHNYEGDYQAENADIYADSFTIGRECQLIHLKVARDQPLKVGLQKENNWETKE